LKTYIYLSWYILFKKNEYSRKRINTSKGKGENHLGRISTM
jgi:hypothetical protein